MLIIEQTLLVNELNALALRADPARARGAVNGKVVLVMQSGATHEGWVSEIQDGDVHVHMTGTPTGRDAIILLSRIESFHYRDELPK